MKIFRLYRDVLYEEHNYEIRSTIFLPNVFTMQLSKAAWKSSDCIGMCYMKNTTMRSDQQLQTRWIKKLNIIFQNVINFYKQLYSATRIVPDNNGLFLLLFVSRYGCCWVLPICLSFQKAKSFRIHTQT